MSNNNFKSFWQSPLWSDILTRTRQAESIWYTFQKQKILIERRKIVGNLTGLYILGADEQSLTLECLHDISQKVVRKTDLFLQIEPIDYFVEEQRAKSKEQSRRAKLSLIYEGAEQQERNGECPNKAAHPSSSPSDALPSESSDLPPQDEGEMGKNSPFLEGAEQQVGKWGCLENGNAPFRRFIEPVTALIPLMNTTEKKIFENFKEKGRYNIRVAERRGVITQWVRADDLCTFLLPGEKNTSKKTYAEVFFELLEETTKRDKFSHNALSYYQTFLRVLEAHNAGGLQIATKDGTLHAAAIFVYWGDHAIYYYGASSSLPEIRRDNGTYLLQWSAIREALSRGCVDYDFLGISSYEGDKLAGVTTFKMGFGPEKVIVPREKVIVFRPTLLKLLQGVNTLRKILRSR